MERPSENAENVMERKIERAAVVKSGFMTFPWNFFEEKKPTTSDNPNFLNPTVDFIVINK